MRDRDFWREAERYIDVPEEDEDGEMPDPEDYIEDVADKMTDEQLKDPMAYLEDIYGDDAAKQAIEIAGIDVNAAAEAAVDDRRRGALSRALRLERLSHQKRARLLERQLMAKRK